MDGSDLLNEIARRRVALGLSQREVAQRMGSSQPGVARLERRAADPKLSTVVRYAAAVEADLDVISRSGAAGFSILVSGVDGDHATAPDGLTIATGDLLSGPARRTVRAVAGTRPLVVVADAGGMALADDLAGDDSIALDRPVLGPSSSAADVHRLLRDLDPRRQRHEPRLVVAVVGTGQLDGIALRQVQLASRAVPVVVALTRPSDLLTFEVLADTARTIVCGLLDSLVDRARAAGAMAPLARRSPEEVAHVLALLGHDDGAVANGGVLHRGKVRTTRPVAVTAPKTSHRIPIPARASLPTSDQDVDALRGGHVREDAERPEPPRGGRWPGWRAQREPAPPAPPAPSRTPPAAASVPSAPVGAPRPSPRVGEPQPSPGAGQAPSNRSVERPVILVELASVTARAVRAAIGGSWLPARQLGIAATPEQQVTAPREPDVIDRVAGDDALVLLCVDDDDTVAAAVALRDVLRTRAEIVAVSAGDTVWPSTADLALRSVDEVTAAISRRGSGRRGGQPG